MDTSSRLFRPSAALLATGGLLWTIKFVVIAATDGATGGTPELVAGVLYVSAVTLMALGTGGLAVALLVGRHPLVRAAAGVVGVMVWWFAYLAIEAVAQAITGDTDPAWVGEEVGVLTTGAVLLTVGLLLLRAPGRGRLVASASH